MPQCSYHVTLIVRGEVFDRALEWFETVHVPEVLSCPGFIEATVLTNKAGAVESSSREIRCCYTVESVELLTEYLKTKALELRQKALEQFPGEYSAHRDIYWRSKKILAKPSHS